MIKLRFFTKIFSFPYQSYTRGLQLLSNYANYSSSTNSLSEFIENTNLSLIPPPPKPTKTSTKQNLKNGNELDTSKLSEDLKTILQGVLQKFNHHQLDLIKQLDRVSVKSVQNLKQRFDDKESSQYQKLVHVRNQSKEIKKAFISTIQLSASQCLKSLENYKEQLEKKTGQNLKGKNQNQKGRGILLKIFQTIKKEIQQILSQEKAKIQKMVKIKGEAYLERARLNKKEENEEWFDQNFLKVYRRDLKDIRNVVQDSGGEFCLKINDMIVRTEYVETKKNAKMQSK